MTAAQPSRSEVKPMIVHPVGEVYKTRRRARTTAVSSRSLKRAGIALAAATTLLLTAYIGEYASVARASYQRAALRADLRRALQENSNLHAQAEALERPARIDHLARAMNMEQRNDAEFVKLAPPAPRPAPAERDRPILAGFLPESWVRHWSGK